MAKKPYIGAIVHFVNASDRDHHRPAIVVNVHEDNSVDLQIFGSSIFDEANIEFKNWISFDPGTMPIFVLSWHWIEEGEKNES